MDRQKIREERLKRLSESEKRMYQDLFDAAYEGIQYSQPGMEREAACEGILRAGSLKLSSVDSHLVSIAVNDALDYSNRRTESKEDLVL